MSTLYLHLVTEPDAEGMYRIIKSVAAWSDCDVFKTSLVLGIGFEMHSLNFATRCFEGKDLCRFNDGKPFRAPVPKAHFQGQHFPLFFELGSAETKMQAIKYTGGDWFVFERASGDFDEFLEHYTGLDPRA